MSPLLGQGNGWWHPKPVLRRGPSSVASTPANAWLVSTQQCHKHVHDKNYRAQTSIVYEDRDVSCRVSDDNSISVFVNMSVIGSPTDPCNSVRVLLVVWPVLKLSLYVWNSEAVASPSCCALCSCYGVYSRTVCQLWKGTMDQPGSSLRSPLTFSPQSILKNHFWEWRLTRGRISVMGHLGKRKAKVFLSNPVVNCPPLYRFSALGLVKWFERVAGPMCLEFSS